MLEMGTAPRRCDPTPDHQSVSG